MIYLCNIVSNTDSIFDSVRGAVKHTHLYFYAFKLGDNVVLSSLKILSQVRTLSKMVYATGRNEMASLWDILMQVENGLIPKEHFFQRSTRIRDGIFIVSPLKCNIKACITGNECMRKSSKRTRYAFGYIDFVCCMRYSVIYLFYSMSFSLHMSVIEYKCLINFSFYFCIYI